MGTRIKLKNKKTSSEIKETVPIHWESLFLKGFVIFAVVLIIGLVFFCFLSIDSL